MKILLLSCFWLLGAHAQEDPPDLERETRYHQIYQNYNLSPTSDDSWSSKLTADKPNTYSIQSGDTLWNLSQTLFGDPYFWPKVWSLNREHIQNPHEVVPNQVLKFTPGTTGEAPSLELAKSEAETPPVEVAVKEEALEVALEKAEKSLPSKKSKTPANLPPSVPNWTTLVYEPPKFDLSLGGINSQRRTPNPVLSHYLTDEELSGVGEIRETELAYDTAAPFQIVTVHLEAAQDYKTFMVVKPLEKIKDSDSGHSAYLVQVQGEIEIIEKVNEDKGLYHARVKTSVFPVEVGNRLVARNIATYSPEGEGAYANVEATIVGGTFDPEQSYFATTSLLVLSAGSAQGLSEGQLLKIYKNPLLRNPNTKARNTQQMIGSIKILQTATNMSTGLVISSDEEIWRGDATVPFIK